MAEFTDEDNALLADLGVEVEMKGAGARTPREEHIIAGFAEIQSFVDEHGRTPRHDEGNDIFERLYAVRLDRLRTLEGSRSLLGPMDHQKLLEGAMLRPAKAAEELDDDALLAELGVDVVPDSISELRHVRSAADKRAAEEIANRAKCEDFEAFRPMFDQVKQDLSNGIRKTRPFESMDQIKTNQWFVVGGQIAYVASVGEEFITEYDRRDSRLRVIYDNGTESEVLQRSLQRALHRDGTGRAISDPDAGPLFSGEIEEGDEETGTIYVLRSKSSNAVVAANRNILHKIGVTGGKVERRIYNAQFDPTFMLAEVEIVATYRLANVNRVKLENLIHRFFDPARLNIEIKDRFGNPVTPREWFLVPLSVIDQAVSRIKDGTITDYRYDPSTATLRRAGSQ